MMNSFFHDLPPSYVWQFSLRTIIHDKAPYRAKANDAQGKIAIEITRPYCDDMSRTHKLRALLRLSWIRADNGRCLVDRGGYATPWKGLS